MLLNTLFNIINLSLCEFQPMCLGHFTFPLLVSIAIRLGDQKQRGLGNLQQKSHLVIGFGTLKLIIDIRNLTILQSYFKFA